MRNILLYIIILIGFIKVDAQTATLTLQQCREMALENSEDMKIATFQNENATLQKGVARSAYFPKIDASATYAYFNADMEMDMSDTELTIPLPPEMGGMMIDVSDMIPESIPMKFKTDMFMVGATLQQPIYAGGKIIAGNKMANTGIEITEQYAQLTRMEVVAEVEKAYWNYYLIEDKIELLKQYEALLDSLQQTITDMISVEMATEGELLKISSRTSNIKYQMQKAINGKELLRMQLCRIVGLDLNSDIILTDTLSINSFSGGVADLSSRPEYIMMQKQVELKEQEIKSVRGDYLPMIGAMAGYTYLGDIDNIKMNKPIPMVMASINIPIFHFGEGHKKVKSAKIARDIKQEEFNKNKKLLEIEVQYAERNLQDVFLLVATAEIGLEQAKDNLERSQNSYEMGMGTLLDVLDAQTQWQEAYSNLVEAKIESKFKEIDYLKATGNL